MEQTLESPGTHTTVNHPNPEHILQVGMGFWASKTLLVAVQLRLFTLLATGPKNPDTIKTALGLHERAHLDFLDALVALGFLRKTGSNGDTHYHNSPEADFFLDRNKPSYLGGILEMSNNRLFKYWNNLEEGLKTGLPQNELKTPGVTSQFDAIYSSEESLTEFLGAMAGVQMGAFMAFAGTFDFSRYSTFCDAGGANGALSIQIALKHPHLQCTSFDLPAVEPVAKSSIARAGVSARVTTVSGDFFNGTLPTSDVIAMGNVLHDWNDEEKLRLMTNAYNALPEGGAFVCIENIIDNDRSRNAFGLLMSLNMLIETKGGSDYTFNDFDRWAHSVGFKKTEWMPLAGPTSAAIAYK